MAIINKEVFEETMQEKLEEPTLWNTLAEVTYTSTKIIHKPYRTLPTSAAYTRGAQYAPADPESIDDVWTIDTTRITSEFMDHADLAQNGYINEVEMATAQAIVITEDIEREFLGAHVDAGINYGATGAGDATALTITGGVSGNVADTFGAIKVAIEESRGGLTALNSLGGFAVVTPALHEIAVSYARKNGYMVSDEAFTGGEVPMISDFRIYKSNLLDSTTDAGITHCIVGVRKSINMGILNTTFGKVEEDRNPDRRSGVDITSRVDMKRHVYNNDKNFIVDLNFDNT